MTIALATIAVQKDEKAYRLAEWNMIRPPLHQWRRWQVVFVNRGDRLAEFWTDLGPSESFPDVPQFNIPALWEHTVAELQDIAEQQRLKDDYWQKFAAERQAESTLIPDFLEQKDEKWRVINNQSSFGPLVSHQRNGFSKKAAREWHESRTGA